MYRNLLLVGGGSFIGGISRYLAQTYIQGRFPSSFPLGTLLVNISGCFVIGAIYALAARGTLLTADARLFLATGLCGGYTTFSSFAFENVSLLSDGEWFYFSLYLALSIVLGLSAAYAGTLLVKSI